MTLQDIIIDIAVRNMDKQLSSGAFPPGNNGPYLQKSTPVRTSSHWLLVYSACYRMTGDDRYLDVVRRISDYLLSDEARPFGYAYFSREDGFDRANGPVGQAWAFEALYEAYQALGESRFAEIIEEIFFQHTFDTRLGLWYRLETDGKRNSLDRTFNHQLWFAAASSFLASENAEMRKTISRFLDLVPRNLVVLENGLIFHKIRSVYNNPLKNVYPLRCFLDNITDRAPEMERSIGYHSFNMYAFGLLRKNFPAHKIWEYEHLDKMIKYMSTEQYKKDIERNKFAYPYNVPGFEVPCSLYMLKDITGVGFSEDTASVWINKQFSAHYDPATCTMSRNTSDAAVLTARVYELTRMAPAVLAKIKVVI